MIEIERRAADTSDTNRRAAVCLKLKMIVNIGIGEKEWYELLRS
jgi:hypothetical protein